MTALGIILLVIAVALMVFLASTMLRAPQPADAWRIAGTSSISPAAQSFYLDYIRRHTNYRRAGAVILGVLSVAGSWLVTQNVVIWGTITAVSSPGWCDGSGLCTNPSPDGSMAGVLLPACILGAILGGLLAETYRMRPLSGLRQASLDARAPRPLIGRALAAWILTALAIAISVTVWIAMGTPSLIVGLLPGLIAVGLAETIQIAITSRRRPVLAEEAMEADHNMRRAVSESVTWLELGAATLAIGWAGMTAGNLIDTGQPTDWQVGIAGVLSSLGFFSVIPALIYVHRSSLVKPPSQNPSFAQPASNLPAPHRHLAVPHWIIPKTPSITSPGITAAPPTGAAS